VGLLSSLRATLDVALRRRRFEDDVSTELQFHLDAYADDLMRDGVPPAEARRRARLEFGSAEGLKEELRAARGQQLLDELRQDARYALRRLGRSRVPSVVAVLALGVGLNAAVFGVIQAALLRPLPHPGPDRLVTISSRSVSLGREHQTAPLDFFDIEQRAASFAHVAAYFPPGFTLTGGAQAERVGGARASSGIFDVFGVRPALGRGFLPEEDHAGAAPVAVISHALWVRRFEAAPRAIGQAIVLSGRPYTLVGVLPEGFHAPTMWPRMPDVWVPIGLDANVGRRDARMLRVIGRLQDGVTIDRARAELTALGDALAREHPDTNTDTRLTVTPMLEQLTRDVRPSLYALAAAAIALLLVACGNAAGLLIGGALERRHEFATRLALGASRARIIRQIVAENLIVGLLAAAAGFVLALWARDVLVGAATAAGVPRAAEIGIGPLTFVLAALVSLGCTFACALATAVEATRPVDLRVTRGAGASTAHRGRGRAVLIAVEAALSLALLVGAALLARSFFALHGTNPGFDTTRIATTRLSPPSARYPAGRVLAGFYDRVVEGVRALPGVDGASVVDWLPVSGFGASIGFQPAGTPAPEGHPTLAELRVVSVDYFETLGIPVVAGRPFDRRDVEGAPPVVVINAALARAYFGSTNPIGRHLTVHRDGPLDVEIAGVVGDVRDLALSIAPGPGIYAPKTQEPWLRSETRDLVVRTRADLAALGPAIQGVLRELEPDMAYTPLQPMDDVVDGALKRPRFYASALSLFAGIAVLLAGFGIYGTVTSAVAVRRRELGVRLALGATRPHVLMRAARTGAAPTLIGVAAGVPLALAGGRILRDQLYGIEPMDWVTILALAGFMAAITLVAALTPAVRATRIDPVSVLKHE
jgi:putative ABC transport system permease protein